MKQFKCCLLGSSGTGKSSLMQRYITDQFFENQAATSGAAFMSKNVGEHKLNIWDTAGQERFSELQTLYYRDSHICCLVYDVTDLKSIRQIARYIRRLYVVNPNAVRLIVGNKSDLPIEFDENVVRGVILEEFPEYEAEFDYYILTSAKTGDNVDLMFVEGVKRALQAAFRPAKPNEKQAKKSCCV